MYDDDDDCFEAGYEESDDMAESPKPIEATASEVEDKPLPPPPERNEQPQRQRETRERDNPFKNARVRPLSAQMARKGIRMVLVVRNDGKAILYSGSK